MTVDGIFLFIGLLINAIAVFYVTRLQLKIQKTVIVTRDTVKAIHEETNGMRMQLEEAARAEGRLQGRISGRQDEIDRQKNDRKKNDKS